MSAIPMARRPLCRSCRSATPGKPCPVLRFWTPREPGSDTPRGHRWLERFTTAEKQAQHARAAGAAGYVNGQQETCPAYARGEQ